MATEEIDSHRLDAEKTQDRQEAEPRIPATFGNRYRVERELKRSLAVSTLLAIDVESGLPVVVKTTPAGSMSPAARKRLDHEAETLGRLNEPSVAPLLGMGSEAGWMYLVMPYIEGVTLRERLAAGPLPLADALTVGRRMLAALDATHALGVLHRDIKPANVIVDSGSPIHRVTLIDFGLARSALLDQELRHETVGTARYISPEQAGLLDRQVDERSDLYSAGVLLFECLAGQPPFQSETIGELLRLHLTAPAPELRGLGLAVPRALDEVVGRLLAKDPRDRYQAAAAALADLEAIEAAHARGIREPALVVGMRDARHTLTEPAFVGRERELDELRLELRRAALGEGRLVRIEAESGGGKTRVILELAQRAMRDGAWVLRGGGVDQAAPKPFQLLSGIADDMAAALGGRERDAAAAISDRLGEHRHAVCAALPQLAEPLGVDRSADQGPELFAENRSLAGLSALLEVLGSPERPALVLLDDCQWGDELTLKLLRQWQDRAGDAPPGARHVTILVGFRSEEVPDDHLLRRLRGPCLQLPNFSDSDVRSLAESMGGDLPEEALQTVAERSDGNPFMASAVLRGLVECGALVDGPHGWSVDAEALAEVQSSRQAAALLSRRLELLPPATTELLAAGAVLGKDFEIDLAARLAGQTAAEARAAFAEAVERHMVWTQDDGERGAFVHDKLREALLSELGDDRRRELHGRTAVHLEQRDAERVFELAYHFDAAGEPDRALPYALRAAREARERHALEVAEEQYRIAQRGGGEADRASRLQIAQGLGDVLMLRGRYDQAEQELSRALPLAEDKVTRAQIQGRVGELAFKRGDVASASRSTEKALKLLGRRVPRPGTWVVLMVIQAVIQALHSLLPRAFVGRRPLERSESDLLAARLLSSLAHSYWFERGKVPTLWTHLLGMNLAERYPPTPELGQAYSEHAPVMTMLPWLSRGIRYAQRSLEIRRSLGDVWGEGRSLHFYGIVLYSASEYAESIERCTEAIRLLERTGDRWELNTARWHTAFCLYRLGRLEEAVATAKRVHRDGLDIGDAQAAGISLGAWSKASGGRVPAEAAARELHRPRGDVHTAAEVLQAEAVRLLAAGRPAQAVERLREAHRIVKAKGLKQEYVAPIQPWLATALREEAEGLPTSMEWKRQRLLRQARTAARRGRRQARSFRNNLPHALRECALAEASLGHDRRARQLLGKSLDAARAQSARFELGQSLLARGRLGWESAPADLAEAEECLGETRFRPPIPHVKGIAEIARTGQQPVTLSLADRFNTLLDGGRQIASALSRQDIFAAVREAGVTLLRGERCTLLEVPEGGGAEDVRSVSDEQGGSLDAHCRMMAIEAIEAGTPVVHSVESASDESTSDELALSGVRSALCAPIFVRNRAAGCFYVSHRGVAGLFGEDDMRLAAFVATLAGAALENSEGFAAVQDLTRSLEKRVQDRTAELEESNRRLDLSLSQQRDAYERERSTAEQLKHQAFHDPLTDLANRGLLADRVEHALARAKRLKSTVAVLFLDLDDFKTINDSLGHTIGDQLLVAVAERLRECLRESDTAARLGGDEFAILIEDVPEPGDVARTAERLIDALEAPFALEDKEVFVHASIGVALGHGPEEETSGDLLRNADLAMYIAKGQGKRRYEFFKPSMHSGVVERLALKADLQRALEHEEFVLHYQPIVQLDGARIVGMEALVRWQHPERGLLAPDQFIPLAEETGLIRSMGEWVLREACSRMRAWQIALGRELTLTVNLSPRQVSEPTLVQEVAAALGESGLPPGSLVLEITESVLMGDTETTTGKLGRLQGLGVRLAIDDFGTGYSSLEYLKRLPIDMIKVAKPFVDDVTRGREQSDLAEAIIRLGDTFGLETVAEGIEHPEQALLLRELGCPLGQGFFFSVPLRVAEAEAALAGAAAA